MNELDWSTEEGLTAITDYLAGRIEGWRQPVAYAVAMSPATSSPEWDFPYVNRPGGRHGLPAVVLASVNLAAWRSILTEIESNPMRTMCAVFVADLDDPVSSEADGCLRVLLDQH